MPPRARVPLRHAIALAVGFAVVGPLSSCAETSGEAISLHTGVIGATSTGEPVGHFTTLRGWTVELSAAYVVVGPIYLYSEPPQAHWLDPIIGRRSAFACPAHAQYDRGTVLGEVLWQVVVDLQSGRVEDTGLSRGEAGSARSAELHLHPLGKLSLGPSSRDPALLEGHTAWVAGTASRDGVVIPFEGGLTIPAEGTLRIVESIEADMLLRDASERPGRAVVEVLLDQWFANVEFDTLAEAPSGDVRVIEQDTQAYTAWLSGARSRYAYRALFRDE